MRIFQLCDKLVENKEQLFDLEKTIQDIIENNFSAIFPNMELLKTEFSIGDFRIDTLAFDSKQKSFVVVEYKKIENRSLSDQGVSYRQTLLSRKEKPILLYNKKIGKTLDESDFNWNKIRVIFISPAFTKYQKEISKSSELQIELYEIKKYQNGIITLDRIGDHPKESTDNVDKSPGRNDDTPAIADAMKDLWGELKNAVDNACKGAQCVQTKTSSRYKLNQETICSLLPQKNSIFLKYSTKDESLIQPSGFVQKRLRKDGGFILCSVIKDSQDIKKAMPLIKKIREAKT